MSNRESPSTTFALFATHEDAERAIDELAGSEAVYCPQEVRSETGDRMAEEPPVNED